ncbi:unnamed protein product [Pleuronectes platessa]|uniref:Uncharacterized protein n=1 Tax=Pleuronectes platessa TaxID=8262 RepID=A0A9N7TM27_PLEPL|nr:unnamed protein product [Pleuronectes platessa]
MHSPCTQTHTRQFVSDLPPHVRTHTQTHSGVRTSLPGATGPLQNGGLGISSVHRAAGLLSSLLLGLIPPTKARDASFLILIHGEFPDGSEARSVTSDPPGSGQLGKWQICLSGGGKLENERRDHGSVSIVTARCWDVFIKWRHSLMCPVV